MMDYLYVILGIILLADLIDAAYTAIRDAIQNNRD